MERKRSKLFKKQITSNICDDEELRKKNSLQDVIHKRDTRRSSLDYAYIEDKIQSSLSELGDLYEKVKKDLKDLQ